jgi:hypothetical protein
MLVKLNFDNSEVHSFGLCLCIAYGRCRFSVLSVYSISFLACGVSEEGIVFKQLHQIVVICRLVVYN